MNKFLMLMLIMCSLQYSLPAAPTVSQQEQVDTITETTQFAKITGKISWYGKQFHGRLMANGDLFDMYKLTCAHPYFPFGTKLLVETLTGNSVIVEVTDRGPFTRKRILDLSYSAAKALGMLNAGSVEATITKLE
jgi:rare lipoprotein A (peptidoglycan hydrolase)